MIDFLIEVPSLCRWGCYHSFLKKLWKKEKMKQKKIYKCKLLVKNNLKLHVRFPPINISSGLDFFFITRYVICLLPQTRCRYKTVYTIYLYIPAWNNSIDPSKSLKRSINLNLVNKRLLLEVTPVCSTQWSFRVPSKMSDLASLWKRLRENASKSLLKKHLTPDRYEKLKNRKTKLGGTLADCIRSGRTLRRGEGVGRNKVMQ